MSVKDSVLPSRAMAFWGLAAVLLLAAGSPPVQAQNDVPVGTESFSIPNLGGWSTTSNGTESEMRSGYGRIRAEAGSTTPSGIAIFGFRQGGVLIAEAGVPATEAVQEGRIFAEVRAPVNTGLAIANPNDAPATILFYFRDAQGMRFGDGHFELGAHEQTARFLDQAPFNSGDEVSGTFTFTSSEPITVIALRGLTNQDGEFLMTTLPVAPLASTLTDTVYFPHFTDGDGWVTQVILVNPTDRPITGTVRFLGPGSGAMAAAPAVLTLDDDRTGSEFPYSIPAGSSQRFTTSNPSGRVTRGSVRATPNPGNVAPSGLVVFSYTPGGVKTVSESGVPALPAGSAFRVYAESSGTPNQPGSIRTGLAITNAADTVNMVTLAVTSLDGSMAMGVAPVTLPLPPSGQVARFLDEIFDSLPGDFSGVLRVTSTADVAIVGLRLRINDLGELKMTTTSPSDETGASTMMDRYFPHIVDSAGWSTQFILFSGTAGQASSGTLSYFDTGGEPFVFAPGLTAGTQLSVSTLAAGFNSPAGVWGDGESLYITDRLDHTIHKVDIATGVRSGFAGQSGMRGTSDGTGGAAAFWFPHALWGDGSDLYVADGGGLRKVALSTGEVTTVASGAFGGIWGDGSHLYATETERHRIVRIDPETGAVSPFAGSNYVEGVWDGVGVEASFSYPDAIWGDGTHLYVTQNSVTIRRISLSTGEVTTIGEGLRVSPFNSGYLFRRGGLFGVGSYLYIAESWLATIRRMDLSTGKLTIVAGAEQRGVTLGQRPEAAGFADGVGPRARFDDPNGLWSDGRNLYIADAGNGAIRRAQGVPNAPVLTEISPNHADRGTSVSVSFRGANFVPDATEVSFSGSGIVVDSIHVLDSSNLTATLRVSPSAEMGRRDVAITTPFGTSYAQAFNVHLPTLTMSSITSGNAGLAYTITLTGTGFIENGTTVSIGGSSRLTEVSVDSSTQLSATVRIPASATPGVYQLYVTTAVGRSNHLDFTVLPAVSGVPTQMEVDFFVGNRYQRGAADGVLRSSQFNQPSSIWGNDAALYVTDTGNHTIRKIERTTGEVSTFAGSAEDSGFVDGPREVARFQHPDGIWGDGVNLYVADKGNNAVRRIDLASGAVTTLVGAGSGLLSPTGLWGVADVLYVSDSGNGAIRSIDLRTGSMATLAAGLASPAGLWGDSATLYVADLADHTIRTVDYATGTVTTLAGRSASAGSENDTGGAARFNAPRGVWGNASSLFIADTGNRAIRRIDRTSGVVDILAGSPLLTTRPEAGTGRAARILSPTSIWASGGEFYIVDSDGHAVRRGRQSLLAPLLRGVTPAILSSGTNRTLILSGENFFGEIEVLIGSYSLTVRDVTVVDERTIRATVRIDAGSTGQYTLSVNTPYGRTYRRTIAVDPPTLTSLSPSTAHQGFTTEFTAKGSNFGRGVRVEIEGEGARLTASAGVMDSTTLKFSVQIDVDAAPGPRSIRLQTPGGTTQALSFTIVPPPTPKLSGLTPDRAVQGTSLQVRLEGEHFIDGATEIVVDGAGVRSDYFSFVDHNNADVTFIIDPTAAPGVRNVRVATPGGQSDPQTFLVEAPAPAATSVNPATLTPGGARNVTITGSGFAGGSVSVSVDGAGVIVTNVYVVNDSTLVATLSLDPTTAPGSRAIHVTTPANGRRTLTLNIAVPTIGEGTQLRVSTLSTRSPIHPSAIWGDGTNLYIAENQHLVKKVVLATGEVIPLAGDPSAYGSRDGIGSAAQLSINAIWGDGIYLYLSERRAIRRLELATNEVTTVAGSNSVVGTADGVGSQARFAYARGILGDGANLYVTDSDASSVRKIELATGAVTTVATLPILPEFMRPSFPVGIWGDGTRLYVADAGHLRIHEIVIATGEVTAIAGTGIPATEDGVGTDASFTYPDALWGDGQNLFIADGSTVRKLHIADRVVTTIAGTPNTSCCVDGTGRSARLRARQLWSDGFRLYWAGRDRIRYAVPAGAGARFD